MVREEWLKDDDVVLTKFAFKYFQELMEFKREYNNEWNNWKEKKQKKGAK